MAGSNLLWFKTGHEVYINQSKQAGNIMRETEKIEVHVGVGKDLNKVHKSDNENRLIKRCNIFNSIVLSSVIIGSMLLFISFENSFSQEVNASRNTSNVPDSELRMTSNLESLITWSLMGTPLLESTSREEFITTLSNDILDIRQGLKDYSTPYKNQSLLMRDGRQAKSDWFGVNEERMAKVLIWKRDRDRVSFSNWETTEKVEMTRNQDGLLTRLRVRSGQTPDTTVFVTDYEYDQRGYPLHQRFHVQDSTRLHLFLHLEVHYDSLGRLAHMNEHRYSLVDSTLHDSVMTRFNYQNQQRMSLRVENGRYGHRHSDTTRVMFVEGSETEPLRLIIQQSRLERSEQSGVMLRLNQQFRYTYPDMQDMLDYISQVSYFYDIVPFQIDLYNAETENYQEQFRVHKVDEGTAFRLSHQVWNQGLSMNPASRPVQNEGPWVPVEEIYINLDPDGYPMDFSRYDVELGDLYLYEMHLIESQEQSTSAEPEVELPGTILLYQNYPNPFNPVTQITFELMDADWVTLTVYDALGRRIRTLADGLYTSGRHQLEFDGSALPSGQYYYRLEAGDAELTKVMTLAK